MNTSIIIPDPQSSSTVGDLLRSILPLIPADQVDRYRQWIAVVEFRDAKRRHDDPEARVVVGPHCVWHPGVPRVIC